MKQLMHTDEALGLIRHNARTAPPLPVEWVPTAQALGRVLAEDIQSPEDLPAWPNSAMDGYVLCHKDTFGALQDAPILLPIKGEIAAGKPWDLGLSPLEHPCALSIMTGATLPQGAFDTVLRLEESKITKDAYGQECLLIQKPLKPLENIREAGIDFRNGAHFLDRQQRVLTRHLQALAGLGIHQLPVWSRPSVAVVSTGSELCDPDAKHLPLGHIRNASMPYLVSQLTQMGAAPISLGICLDDAQSFSQILQETLASPAEALITTGAVSVGAYDFIEEVLLSHGALVHFHKLALRPGKPLLFAEVPRPSRSPLRIFALPGNPVSTAVGFHIFVCPWLQTRMGANEHKPLPVHLAEGFQKPEDLTCFFMARIHFEGGRVTAHPIRNQGSYALSSFAQAQGFLEFPYGKSKFSEGEILHFHPISFDVQE